MSLVRLTPVNVGPKKIKIPVAEIKGKKAGKRVLITAGSDGDEYAGIEAAYRIIDKYKNKNFAGNLTVIPILNIPGFEKGVSWNPMDGKYPKNIYPGNRYGSASERLVDWLNINYLKNMDFWLDLHGGARDEYLEPYFYLFETKNKDLNITNEKLLKMLNSPKIIYRKPGSWKKPDELAKNGTIYVITEAGCLGLRNEKSVKKHLEWTDQVMRVLEMIPGKKTPNKPKSRIYRNIARIKAPKAGIWYPAFLSSRNLLISKKEKWGEIRDLSGKAVQELYSPQSGEFLFGKMSMYCKKGDEVMEIAY